MSFVDSVELVSAEMHGSTTEVTVDLTKGQVLGSCVPFVTWKTDTAGGEYGDQYAIRAQIVDNNGTPAVRLSRLGGGAVERSVYAYVQVVEFGSAVRVQHGTVDETSISVQDDIDSTITEVDTSRSFVISSWEHASSDPDALTLTGRTSRFVNGTTVRHSSENVSASLTVNAKGDFYVIEDLTGDFMLVNHYTVQASNPASASKAITAVSDLAKSFLVGSWGLDGAAGVDDTQYLKNRIKFASTSSVSQDGYATSGSTTTVRFSVVELLAANALVQYGDREWSSGDYTETGTSLTAIDLDKSIVIPTIVGHCYNISSQGSSGGHPAGALLRMWLGGTDESPTLNFDRTSAAGSNPAARFTWQAIRFE